MNTVLGLALSDHLRVPHHPHRLVDAFACFFEAMEHPLRLALAVDWLTRNAGAVRNVRGGTYLKDFEFIAGAFGVVKDVKALPVNKSARLPTIIEL